MADPIITYHDGAGTQITAPLALPQATPGTPTAATVVSVRNNNAAGGPVDPLTNGVFSILARLDGAVTEPVSTGLAFLDTRACQVRITAVTAGCTAKPTGWRPLGSGVSLALGNIPDGGIVTLELRTLSSLSAALTDVELFFATDSTRSVALPTGAYQLMGNFVDDGARGVLPDPDFDEVREVVGSLAPDSPADDSVDIWTRVVYYQAGVRQTFEPAPAEIVFTAVDGDAASLASGEAYYAAITLDGTDTPNVTKGSKAAEPLNDDDKPNPPAGESLAGWVQVPFGLAIDTVEDEIRLGFFGLEVVSGLQVRVGGGRAAVGGHWVHSQTPTITTLADDSALEIYVTTAGGLEIVTAAAGPTDGRSMLIWEVTTASGAVTVTRDRRKIGASTGASAMSRYQTLYGASWDANATLTETAVVGATMLPVAELTGTVTINAGNTAVVGAGTAFTTEVEAGSSIITPAHQVLRVKSVTDATNLVLERRPLTAEAAVTVDVAGRIAGGFAETFLEIRPLYTPGGPAKYGFDVARRTPTVTSEAAVAITLSSDSTNDTSAGTGARQVLVKWINSDGAEVESTLSMNGQTAVTVGTGFFVNAMRLAEHGSFGEQAGTIYAGTGTVTAGVPAEILNQMAPAPAPSRYAAGISTQAIYYVPSGKLAAISSIWASAADDVELKVFVVRPALTTSVDGPFVCAWAGTVRRDEVYQEQISAPLVEPAPAESYILVRGASRGAGPTRCDVRVGVALLDV